jgi:8-oxo-dGTP pyrophosphatase MutT (NUDIX family)
MACNKPLSTDQIRELLEKHRRRSLAAEGELTSRRAAVLVPILCLGDGWYILYTRRSDFVNDHKGQVSFPGGAVEAGDDSVEKAALREAQEEIGLDPSQVEILGRLDNIVSISGFIITPVVGQLHWPASFSINYKEVGRIFSIPLTWLADSGHYEARLFTAPTGRKDWVYFYDPYDGEQLWGISARITLQLLEALDLLTDRSISNRSPGSG